MTLVRREGGCAFSIPKADRWAAAPTSASSSLRLDKPLSVSPKRIDGLQRRPRQVGVQPRDPVFQYPQSGSMGCSPGSRVSPSASPSTFSIPKADRWAAARSVPALPTRASHLSVSPKRIDGLQRWTARCWWGMRRGFQYPQSGSMGCSPACPRTPPPRRGPFSIPKADRWAAACSSSRARGGPSATDFQYPQSGSMGCSARAPAPRRAGHAAFQYPQSGSMGCSYSLLIHCRTAVHVALSVSPKRIDGLQRHSA